MTDVRADEPQPSSDDDRLPWLEAVDEDEGDDGPSAAKLIAFVVIGLVAIGLIVGGLFWMGNRTGGDGEPELIAAPEGDYKVKPDEPGGMNVKGEGDTVFAASEGSTPMGAIDTSSVPEAPVAKQTPAAGRPAKGSHAGAFPSAACPAGNRRRHHPARCVRQRGPGQLRLEGDVGPIQISRTAQP